jgi:short-subunit dehydrogenase
VRVTALCPGSTETEFFTVAGENAQVGRRMAPERVVHAALRALDHRTGSVVTGAGNRLLINAPRLAPRQFVTRMAERTMRPAKSSSHAESTPV